MAVVVVVVVLGVRDAGAAQLTASWRDNSGGVASFLIVRRPKGQTSYTGLATVPRGVTSYVDRAVSAGMTYCYRVKAYTTLGSSAYSEEVCGTPVVTSYSVTIKKSGAGTGLVYSSPAGVSCGNDCSGAYSAGQPVILMALPASGSVFAGWSGGCWGTSYCTVTANTAVTVYATFNPTKTIASATSAQHAQRSLTTTTLAVLGRSITGPYTLFGLLHLFPGLATLPR